MKKIEMRWELNGLRWMPSESQSTLFQLEITRTKNGDHSPGWNVFFAIGNFCIVEFGRYNIHHEEPEMDVADGLTSQIVQGAILGHLVADAVGTPYEFKEPHEIPAYDQIDMIPPEGYKKSWSRWPLAIWSDDGSQMLNLVEYYLERKKSAKAWFNDWAERLVRWYDGHLWVDGKSFDAGIQTKQAIMQLKEGVHPFTAARNHEFANGNGSLMRCLPTALFCLDYSDEGFFKEVEGISYITHPHPLSKIACVFYCDIARQLIKKVPLDDAINRVSTKLLSYYKGDELDWCRKVLDGEKLTPTGHGYVVDALWSAIHCLRVTDNYRDCVKTAIALGHDTDTTACIAGGLAGIIYGASSIPKEWIASVASHKTFNDQVLPLISRTEEMVNLGVKLG